MYDSPAPLTWHVRMRKHLNIWTRLASAGSDNGVVEIMEMSTGEEEAEGENRLYACAPAALVSQSQLALRFQLMHTISTSYFILSTNQASWCSW